MTVTSQSHVPGQFVQFALQGVPCPTALPTSKCLVSSSQQAVEHVEVALAGVLSNNSVLQGEHSEHEAHRDAGERTPLTFSSRSGGRKQSQGNYCCHMTVT